jgi:hypothetical protein
MDCFSLPGNWRRFPFMPQPLLPDGSDEIAAAPLCYHGNMVQMERRTSPDLKYVVERVQTGVRMEKRLLKVLRAFADYHDLTLGDLLEGIVLHAFDGKSPFNRASLQVVKELKKVYGLDLDSRASHRLIEARASDSPEKERRRK